MKLLTTTACFLGLALPVLDSVHAEGLTGQYLATVNFAAEGSIKPSLNNRLTANFAPAWTPAIIDLRIEQYAENSFHGVNDSLVRERKFEVQANLNYPLTKELNATVGFLRHTNSTFRDNFNWAIAGLVWNGEIATDTNLTTSVLAEKRTSGGRLFYDTSANIERKFQEKYGVFSAAHIYENFGEFDAAPSRKREFEVGVNYYPNPQYVLGLSYFNHRQLGDPTDRFSMIKLKAGVNF